MFQFEFKFTFKDPYFETLLDFIEFSRELIDLSQFYLTFKVLINNYFNINFLFRNDQLMWRVSEYLLEKHID